MVYKPSHRHVLFIDSIRLALPFDFMKRKVRPRKVK
jgi:hypothetical protein